MTNLKLLAVQDPARAFNPKSGERQIREMLISLDESWEVHLLQSRPVKYKNLPCRCKIYQVPFGLRPHSLLFKALYLLASVVIGVRIVKKHGIHITFCEAGHLYLGFAALLIARLTGRKCLIRVNEDAIITLKLFLKREGFPDPLIRLFEIVGRALERLILRQADWVVTHGPMDYVRIKNTITTDKISFIPLGVDTKKFKPVPKRALKLKRKILGDEVKRVILYVGRLSPIKDLPTLFHAFKRVLKDHEDVVLIVIGSGVEEGNYHKLVKELGIADKVLFLGFIPNEKLPPYYNMADVYVLPSLYEEWSNTIMEAMACGVPVVATAVGANPWLVNDGETGFLVPPCRPDLLAKRISAILDDPQLAERMAKNARKLVRKYDIRIAGQSYRRIMLKLAGAYKNSW